MFGAVKMAKKRNPQQARFDFMDRIPDEPVRRARPWYYLVRNRNAEMMLEFDAHGLPIWVEHDLRQHKPHIYSCIRRANEAARVLKCQVKSCRYDRLAKHWANYSVE